MTTGSQVETGAPLVRLEPVGDAEAGGAEAAPATAADLELPRAAGDASADDRAARGLDDLRSLLLGFDVDPRDEGRGAGRLPAPRGPSWPRPGATARGRDRAAAACSPTSPS